jgi:hypothetical protein
MKPRWINILLLLLLGGTIGAYFGADLAFRFSYARQIKYSKVLEDYYVESRLFDLTAAIMTFKKAEEAHATKIIDDQSIFIRGLFLSLIDLQKTGHYSTKEIEIVKKLHEAKTLMEQYPSYFINQTFYPEESIVARVNNPALKDDPYSEKATNQQRKQLQAAFDYVASLPGK